MKMKNYIFVIVAIILWAVIYFYTQVFCVMQAVSGFPCPGCGGSRAAIALLRGEIAEALRWHPLIFLSLALLPYVAVRYTVFRRFSVKKAESAVFIGIALLYLFVFIVRMLVYFPHTPPLTIFDGAILRQLLNFLGLV